MTQRLTSRINPLSYMFSTRIGNAYAIEILLPKNTTFVFSLITSDFPSYHCFLLILTLKVILNQYTVINLHVSCKSFNKFRNKYPLHDSLGTLEGLLFDKFLPFNRCYIILITIIAWNTIQSP